MVNTNQNQTINESSNNKLPLLTMAEASIFLNLKMSRLRYEIFQKRIPHFKIGRSIRFSEEELTKWVLEHRKQIEND